MSDLTELARNWEEFAQQDPLWAVCSDPNRKGRRWDPDAFFSTGRQEIATVLAYLDRIGAGPARDRSALDFGCGVGRLTQALAGQFERCVGVDISPTMIQLANNFNQFPDHCTYRLNESSNLSIFSDGSFGFIYTSIVLQHMHTRLALLYLREFGRLLALGGILVFQLPDRSKDPLLKRLRDRLRLRTRLRLVLSRLHLVSYKPFMEVNHVAETRVRSLLTDVGLELIDVQLTNSTNKDFNGRLEFLDREPTRGEISKQYCAVRRQR